MENNQESPDDRESAAMKALGVERALVYDSPTMISDLEANLSILIRPTFNCLELVCHVTGILEDTTHLFLDFDKTVAHLPRASFHENHVPDAALKKKALIDFLLPRLGLKSNDSDINRWDLVLYIHPFNTRGYGIDMTANKEFESAKFKEPALMNQLMLDKPDGMALTEWPLSSDRSEIIPADSLLLTAADKVAEAEKAEEIARKASVKSGLLSKAWLGGGGGSKRPSFAIDTAPSHGSDDLSPTRKLSMSTGSSSLSSSLTLPKLAAKSIMSPTGGAANVSELSARLPPGNNFASNSISEEETGSFLPKINNNTSEMEFANHPVVGSPSGSIHVGIRDSFAASFGGNATAQSNATSSGNTSLVLNHNIAPNAVKHIYDLLNDDPAMGQSMKGPSDSSLGTTAENSIEASSDGASSETSLRFKTLPPLNSPNAVEGSPSSTKASRDASRLRRRSLGGATFNGNGTNNGSGVGSKSKNSADPSSTSISSNSRLLRRSFGMDPLAAKALDKPTVSLGNSVEKSVTLVSERLTAQDVSSASTPRLSAKAHSIHS